MQDNRRGAIINRNSFSGKLVLTQIVVQLYLLECESVCLGVQSGGKGATPSGVQISRKEVTLE